MRIMRLKRLTPQVIFMSKTLILYSTVDGHTHTICERINQSLSTPATLVKLDEHTHIDLTVFDTIVIGASIRYGKHRPAVSDFIEQNKALLNDKKTVFFSVSVVARKETRNTPEKNKYIQKFFTQTQWQPTLAWVLAGKINYSLYSWFDTLMIRFIMWMGKGPTDLNADVTFTDWDSVERLAQEIDALSQ